MIWYGFGRDFVRVDFRETDALISIKLYYLIYTFVRRISYLKLTCKIFLVKITYSLL